MKTININLIGDLGRTPRVKSLKGSDIQDEISLKTRQFCIFSVIGAGFVFVVSLVVLGVILFSTSKANHELQLTYDKITEIKPQIAKYKISEKNVKKLKEIVDLKVLARDQLLNDLLPWSDILSDLSSVIPQNVKVKEIMKTSSRSKTPKTKLLLSGQINANDKSSLKLISFIVLNINQNLPQNTSLFDATIESIKHSEQDQVYDFGVEIQVAKDPKDHPHFKPIKEESEVEARANFVAPIEFSEVKAQPQEEQAEYEQI